MIDELTPFILRTAAQAGGPVTVGGLMERIRHELSEKTIRRHLADLISAGRLRTDTVSDGHRITVTPAPGHLSPAPPPTFFGNPPEPRQRIARLPSKLPIRMRTDAINKAIVDAAIRDGKRPRSAPRRAEVLTLLTEQPMTTSDLAARMGVTLCSCAEHLNQLRRDGLVVRYATLRNHTGNQVALWVSTRLRQSLPDAPPIPLKPTRQRNRRAPVDAATIPSALA